MKHSTYTKHEMADTNTLPGQLISLRKAAARLDISVRGLYRLFAKGDLPKPVKVGGATRIYESDITDYLSSLKRMK